MRVVDGRGAGEVVPDGLLDDQARERLGIRRARRTALAASLLDRRTEHRRRNGQVVDAVAGQAAFVLDRVESRAEDRKRRRRRRATHSRRTTTAQSSARLARPAAAARIAGAVLGKVPVLIVRACPCGRRRRPRSVAAAGRPRAGCRARAAACGARDRPRRRRSRG